MEAQRDGKCIGKIGPGGIDHTVGKVEEFDRAINKREAKSDKGIDAASNDAV